ncbi:unnamed protein product [Amoebophrya sp. A120]|nr:unnamed protein product [Amoebophrya sp. A120]|eukprot:GSA120T00000798001.1
MWEPRSPVPDNGSTSSSSWWHYPSPNCPENEATPTSYQQTPGSFEKGKGKSKQKADPGGVFGAAGVPALGKNQLPGKTSCSSSKKGGKPDQQASDVSAFGKGYEYDHVAQLGKPAGATFYPPTADWYNFADGTGATASLGFAPPTRSPGLDVGAVSAATAGYYGGYYHQGEEAYAYQLPYVVPAAPAHHLYPELQTTYFLPGISSGKKGKHSASPYYADQQQPHWKMSKNGTPSGKGNKTQNAGKKAEATSSGSSEVRDKQKQEVTATATSTALSASKSSSSPAEDASRVKDKEHYIRKRGKKQKPKAQGTNGTNSKNTATRPPPTTLDRQLQVILNKVSVSNLQKLLQSEDVANLAIKTQADLQTLARMFCAQAMYESTTKERVFEFGTSFVQLYVVLLDHVWKKRLPELTFFSIQDLLPSNTKDNSSTPAPAVTLFRELLMTALQEQYDFTKEMRDLAYWKKDSKNHLHADTSTTSSTRLLSGRYLWFGSSEDQHQIYPQRQRCASTFSSNHLRFVGELFLKDLVPLKAITDILDDLLHMTVPAVVLKEENNNLPREDGLDAARMLLKTVGFALQCMSSSAQEDGMENQGKGQQKGAAQEEHLWDRYLARFQLLTEVKREKDDSKRYYGMRVQVFFEDLVRKAESEEWKTLAAEYKNREKNALLLSSPASGEKVEDKDESVVDK